MEALLTVREASRVLRISPPTVRRLLTKGELRGFRVGKVIRLERGSVERLLGRAAEIPINDGSLS